MELFEWLELLKVEGNELVLGVLAVGAIGAFALYMLKWRRK